MSMGDWGLNGQVTPPDLVQGTPEWREARKRRIGASDLGAILGVSPYKTRLELWEEMTGRRDARDISKLPHVRRGIENESVARQLLQERHRVTYDRSVLLHARHPFIAASFDGLVATHCIEIKTMGREKHVALRSVDGAIVTTELATDLIGMHYVAQMAMQLEISGVDHCVFASYRPEDHSMYTFRFLRDAKLQRHLVARAIQFYRWVKRDVRGWQKELNL